MFSCLKSCFSLECHKVCITGLVKSKIKLLMRGMNKNARLIQAISEKIIPINKDVIFHI